MGKAEETSKSLRTMQVKDQRLHRDFVKERLAVYNDQITSKISKNICLPSNTSKESDKLISTLSAKEDQKLIQNIKVADPQEERSNYRSGV